MFKRFEPSDLFQVEIHASKLLTTLGVFVYTIAGLSLLLLHPLLLVLSFIPLCIHAYFTIRKDCLRLSDTSIVYCQQASKHIWRLRNRAGKTFSMKLSSHFRSRWLVSLTFIPLNQGKKLTIVLSPDALTKQNYSLLLSRLWGR